MSLILNIETATEVCSVCISRDDEILAIEESSKQYSHAGNVTLFIQNCCQKANIKLAEIDAVAISQGPGSYTGLRVGLSTAKGICYALDKPLIAVDTLQALAQSSSLKNLRDDLVYCPMIDARRMEVYQAFYNSKNELISPTEAFVITEEAYQDYFNSGQTVVFCGNATTKTAAIINHPLAHFDELLCSATHLVPLAYNAFLNAQFQDLAYFSPNYFKSPNITKSKKNI